jgi:hypothetical protein
MNFVKKTIVSPKLILTLEIELNNSSLTAQEAADRISYAFNSSRSKELSEFIVFLIRETRSSTWDMQKLEINSVGSDDSETNNNNESNI